MPRLHVVAQGDGETSAHAKLPKAGRRGVQAPKRRTLRRDARRNTKTEPMRKEQHEQKSDANSSSKRNRQLGWMKTRQRGVRAAAATEHRHKVRAAVPVQRARVLLRKGGGRDEADRQSRKTRKTQNAKTGEEWGRRGGEQAEENHEVLEDVGEARGQEGVTRDAGRGGCGGGEQGEGRVTDGGRTAIRGRGRSLRPGTSLSRSSVKMLGMDRGMVRRHKRRRTDHDEADRSSEERRRREIIREMPTCCMWIQNETRGTQRRLVVDEEPRTGNSAAVKPEDIGQEQDTNVLDGTGALAATLPMSLERSNVQFDAKEVCTKMAQRYNRVI